ncbi:MAG: glycine zipper protein [Herminiimonas sp.]|nr:glycine zipper protein [Herminiimonas sp.]
MEMTQNTNRIHPLMAGAAASVMLVSLVGVAAITGILPTSHSTAAPSVATIQPAPVSAQYIAPVPVAAPVQTAQEAPIVHHRTVVHHRYVTDTRPVTVAQAEPQRSYAPAPVYQQPVAQNSPIGIGVGAVLGGLLGNQVGGGNGKTLATIAGAVGGGYVGNEVANRY